MKKIETEYDNSEFDLDDYIKRVQAQVKDAEVTIDNVNDFSVCLIEKSNCEKCKNVSTCANSQHGYYLEYINGIFKYSKCKKIVKKEDKKINDNITNYYMAAKAFDASMEKYHYKGIESRCKILNSISSFLIKLQDEKVASGLYLFGGTSVGKTYTLAMIANFLAENGINVVIANFPKLASQLKNLYYSNYDSYEDIMNSLYDAQVLMLDDIGSENLTEWLRDEVISQIISYRLDMKLPLYISSNLSPTDLHAHFQMDKSFDGKVKAKTIMERLSYLCLSINIDDSKKYSIEDVEN